MKKFANLKASAAPVALGLAMVSAISTPAYAQDEAAEESSNTIIVTGSRIARPEVESVSPVTSLSSEEISQTGTTRIEDLTNSLPQVFAGQNAFIANGATGTATVNLRNLGVSRTLVLVNGRRLQPGDPSLPVADLNQIPASLVQRVEVATGGASAVYGADAVAGVVNFIMDTDFEGFQVDGTVSFYQHRNRNNSVVDSTDPAGPATLRDRINARNFGIPGKNQIDGFTFDTTATFGAGFDDGRGHVTGYVGYRQTDPILQADRDHSACALTRSAGNDRITCGGSFNSPNATVVDPTFGNFFFGVADGSDGFTGDGSVNDPPYNYAPINHFQRPNKRWTAGFFADYEISDAVKPYAEFMFMDSRTVAQIAQSGTFFNTTYNVRCGDDPGTAVIEAFSPLLTAGQAGTLCGAGFDGLAAAGDGTPVDTTGDGLIDSQVDRPADGVVPLLIGKRNVEGGPRRSDLRHTAFRAVFGVKGDISDRWSYDVSGQYGTTIFQQTYFNDLSLARLARAIDAVDDGTGNIVCAVNADASTSNDDPACAPYNPFQGVGIAANAANGITQAAVGYVNTPGFQRGETEEFIASGYVTGTLGAIPMASDPVSILFGAEYRKEQLNRNVDTAFLTGDLAGQGGPTTNLNGEFSVRELFTEVLVPIVQDTPGIHNLSLELGYRFSDYTTAGTTHTYKIAGEYAPTDWVKFRGGYNRAVRAPNVNELFAPQRIALFGGTDNCAGTTPTFTAAECANSGVTAAQYGTIAPSPAGQYNQFVGGAANLDVETADTYTAGIVFDGNGVGVNGLVITVDYFNIEINNLVSTLGAQTTLDSCASTGDPLFCNLITRDPISGNVWAGQNGFVTNFTQNIGGLKTSGVDFNVNYNRPVGPGMMTANFVGTWLNELIVDNGFGTANSDGQYDCAGFHGAICGQPNAEWRHQFRLGWQADDGYGLSVRWRHFGSVQLDEFSTDVDLSTDANPDARGNIGAQNYFDLTLNFDIGENLGINLGVNNIFDRDPPLVAAQYGSSNGNTYANVYDPVGRYIFMSGSIKF